MMELLLKQNLKQLQEEIDMWYGKHIPSGNLYKGENPPANPGNFEELTEAQFEEEVRAYKEAHKEKK